MVRFSQNTLLESLISKENQDLGNKVRKWHNTDTYSRLLHQRKNDDNTMDWGRILECLLNTGSLMLANKLLFMLSYASNTLALC